MTNCRSRFRSIFLALPILLIPALLGCSAGSQYKPTGNPILDVRNPDLLERDRVAAAEQAWAQVVAGTRIRERTRNAFKNLAWSSATTPDLRYTTLDLLMSDTSPEGDADSARMARLMLPTEQDRQAVRIILQHAIRANWDGLMPAIIRSFARVAPGYPDQERMERKAIEALNPGKPLETVVFEVFLDPLEGASNREERSILRVAERTRDDAWGLLGRLDTDGSKRVALLESSVDLSNSDKGTQQTLDDLRACWKDFGILPDQAMELAWLRQLRRSDDDQWAAKNILWWESARSIISKLRSNQHQGLELRHLESLRWASVHQPQWLDLSRQDLIELIKTTQHSRTHVKRKPDKGAQPRRERIQDWQNQLVWADLITILVVDQAIRTPSVVEKIFVQRQLDHKDTSTEYGGILDAPQSSPPQSGTPQSKDHTNESYRAILFRPRSRDRLSDERFVASEDMMRFSDRALAHYHFHANERNNEKYAGPSQADFINAETSGRTSLVFTSLKADQLNVDLYQPNGVVIDLGTIGPAK